MGKLTACDLTRDVHEPKCPRLARLGSPFQHAGKWAATAPPKMLMRLSSKQHGGTMFRARLIRAKHTMSLVCCVASKKSSVEVHFPSCPSL